jgi:hypothetical protein
MRAIRFTLDLVDSLKAALSLVFLCWTVLRLQQVGAQTTAAETKLWKAGFEQVYVAESADTLWVSVEHRGLRSPAQARSYVSLLLAKERADRVLVFLPRYHNGLLGQYTAAGDWSPVPTALKEEIYASGHLAENYRFQLMLIPEFAARFGFYEQPVQQMTNVILGTQVFLMPGLSVQTGVLFPISNTLDTQERNIRLAPSNLRFFRALTPRNLLSLSAGMYYTNRYGVVGEYRHVNFNRNFSWGIEASYTGYYLLPSKGLYRAPLDQWVILADLEYRLPFEPEVSVRVSGGQFLNRDRGLRLDMIRQYGVIDVGLFATKTKAGFNAGFQFAFPLFPGKILRTNKLEWRTTEEFRWEYGYNNEDIVARNFRFGYPKLADWTRQYHKSMMR